MSSLPQDIITDVLCRLPVKSLSRFRSVSKPWYSHIDGPDFIKLHLNHSLKTNTSLSLIITHYKENSDDIKLSSVDLDTLDKAVELNNPIEDNYHGDGTKVIGSCNGLLALYNCYCPDDCDDDIALWNPYTKMYQKLPITEIKYPRSSCHIVYGFGYDPVTDDYKLVRLVQFDDNVDYEVYVYSLKSNSWRRILPFPYDFSYDYNGFVFEYEYHGVLANNALHWVVTREHNKIPRNQIVAAFDLSTEEYSEVQEPDYVGKDFYKCVGVLGGLLCFYIADDVCVNVWVLKEYGVKESWTKLFSLAEIKDFKFLSPLVYSKSGDKVLMGSDREMFVWYDLRKKRVEKFRIHGVPYPLKACMCVASLVPLGGKVPIKKKKKKNEKKRKR